MLVNFLYKDMLCVHQCHGNKSTIAFIYNFRKCLETHLKPENWFPDVHALLDSCVIKKISKLRVRPKYELLTFGDPASVVFTSSTAIFVENQVLECSRNLSFRKQQYTWPLNGSKWPRQVTCHEFRVTKIVNLRTSSLPGPESLLKIWQILTKLDSNELAFSFFSA